MDSIDYEDDAEWYADLTDGTGHSLELIDAASDNNDPMSWKASEEIGGTPGATKFLSSASISFCWHMEASSDCWCFKNWVRTLTMADGGLVPLMK